MKVYGIDPSTGIGKHANVKYDATTGVSRLCVDTEITDVTLTATNVVVNLARYSTTLPTYSTDTTAPLQVNTAGALLVQDVAGGTNTTVQYIYATITAVSTNAVFAQAVKDVQINNIGTQTLWVNIGATASANQCTPVYPEETYDETRLSSIGTNTIRVISNTTGTTYVMAGFY